MTPKVSKKDLPYSSQIQKIPLKAAMVFPKKFQDAAYSRGGYKADLGKSSVKLFQDVFTLLFQEITFVTEDVSPEYYQILIIPEIVETHLKRIGEEYTFRASLEYKVSFFDPNHKSNFSINHGSRQKNTYFARQN
jgi:hypothetical protein